MFTMSDGFFKFCSINLYTYILSNCFVFLSIDVKAVRVYKTCIKTFKILICYNNSISEFYCSVYNPALNLIYIFLFYYYSMLLSIMNKLVYIDVVFSTSEK